MVDGRGTALGSSQCVAPDDRDRAQLISSARVTGHRDMLDAGAPVEPFQAVELLDRQGRVWGWEPRWGQRIQLTSVDRAINAAGGCRRMVRRIDQSPVVIPPMATKPVTRNPVRAGSRSESEGFGLFPYR